MLKAEGSLSLPLWGSTSGGAMQAIPNPLFPSDSESSVPKRFQTLCSQTIPNPLFPSDSESSVLKRFRILCTAPVLHTGNNSVSSLGIPHQCIEQLLIQFPLSLPLSFPMQVAAKSSTRFWPTLVNSKIIVNSIDAVAYSAATLIHC